jgi:hypothetical protein
MTSQSIRVLSVLLAVMACLGSCDEIFSKDATPTKANIVFFLIDDLGWADLGCYGSRYYEMPRIDEMADLGMRFTDAYAACCACSPTRASILTGKYPARLHLTDWIPGRTPANAKMLIPDWRKFLPCDEVTIAESNDRAAAEPDLAARLRGKLHEWRISVDARMPRPRLNRPM